MTDINKIVDSLNIPKQLIDKSEALFKALFAPSISELSGTIADNVRLRRFKNQVKILTKAQQILKDKHIDPRKVSLKVLAPLIEHSLYEEDKDLQKKWANLIAYVITDKEEEFLHSNFMRILNLLNPLEAKILDSLHKNFLNQQKRNLQKSVQWAEKGRTERFLKGRFTYTKIKDVKRQSKFIDKYIFSLVEQADKHKLEKEKYRYFISNLVSIGLLKWKIKIDSDIMERNIDGIVQYENSIETFDYGTFIFTPLGIRFIEVCSFSQQQSK